LEGALRKGNDSSPNEITVINVVGQREFQNPVAGGRNIRLDILTKDSTGKNYNAEVQKNRREHIYAVQGLIAV